MIKLIKLTHGLPLQSVKTSPLTSTKPKLLISTVVSFHNITALLDRLSWLVLCCLSCPPCWSSTTPPPPPRSPPSCSSSQACAASYCGVHCACIHTVYTAYTLYNCPMFVAQKPESFRQLPFQHELLVFIRLGKSVENSTSAFFHPKN